MTRDADPWLIVGGDSTIGAALARRAVAGGQRVVRTTRRTSSDSELSLDLADDPRTWVLPERVGVAFLCAAVTSIETCRLRPAETRRVNAVRTVALAERLAARGSHVVFLSTNQVFDGGRPRRPPRDATCPRTEYGRQKADAERAILAMGNATVVRFAKVIGPQFPLIREWVESLASREPIAAFEDMVMAPVPLGFAVEVLARVGQSRAPGVFQVSGASDLTYAAVARRVADRLGVSRDLVRVASHASRGLLPAMAPAHTTLDGRRVRREFGLQPPPVESTLDESIEAAISAIRLAGTLPAEFRSPLGDQPDFPQLSMEAPWAVE